MIGILTKKGIEVNIIDLINKYKKEGYNKIKSKFTVKYKSPIGTFYIEKKNYIIDNKIIIFPRFAGPILLSNKILTQIINKIPNGINIDMNYIGKSNENQITVINHIFNTIYSKQNVNNGFSGLTLKLMAGCGKTYCAMDIISKINQKTLIVVPNTYLLKQWIELLKQFFPNNTIGEYYGKKKVDGDIIVSIINSLVSENFEFKIKKNKITKTYNEFFSEFGLVILDESHIYCTDNFKVVYNRFQSTYMLGLSATPNERLDKADIISHMNIGHVLDAETLDQYKKSDISFIADVHIIKYNAPDQYINTHINPKTQMICVPLIIEDFLNDEYRNKLILDELLKLFNKKLNIFIFSERRNHLEYLYTQFNYILTEQNYKNYENNLSVPELNINKNIVLYGGSTDEDIETAKNNSNVIFTTYSYSSTGVSINKMNAVILCTPRKSKSKQIIGRIFRLNKENNHIKRIIIDIVDNKSVLKNQLYSRMSAYKERNCQIIKSEINYTDIQL